MFRLCTHPTRFGFAVGLMLIALWAFLWLVFFAQVLRAPEKTARQAGQVPELARSQSGMSARPT